MTSKEIREAFFKFFQNKEHQLVPSAPIVVKDDPTLMFTNAGMNQFKDVFLGNKVAKNSRVVDTQKCLRVSGKHNDLEEVGVDTYHHTMFEMLGNWSFGDFFKDEMIPWAWEFLTEEIGLAKDRLYVTIFEGDEEDGLGEDTDAYNAWAKILPAEKILKAGKKDNFWEMGEVGPCGPCSEIHMDIRDEEDRQKVDGATLVNQDHPQVVEIWNLVFMEFNRTKDKSLKPLPNKHVDTGMGFERLCMAIQGVKSNYDTDVFKPSINHLDKIANKKYTASQSKTDIAFRVIADHIRAIAFSIADGQLPSNTGAGYVIRRILRRAVRYGYSFLDLKEPFLYKMLIPLKATLGETFDELNSQHQLIEKVILEEEQSFLRTLEKGIQRFESYCEENPKIIKGGFAFELYDTFGFPIDLTNLLAEEKGLKVDMPAFESELKQQKERSREATKVDTGDWVEVFKDDKEEFIGYDQTSAKVKISRYRKVKQKNKELFQLVFNLTPFYPEGGGQVGDTGYIEFNGEKVSILDTKKENLLIVHFVEELPTNLEAEFHAQVNESKRRKTAANHSATHLLHQALREVLGNHVEQKGSLVHPDYLRFDFSHFQKVSKEELRAIERFVNEKIQANIPLKEVRNIPLEEAKSKGALALFGEKYGDTVRMIQFGESVELCGGTHVSASGSIGLFKIISESAVASGVRRIEALSGVEAQKLFFEQSDLLDDLKEQLKNPKKIGQAVQNLLKENQLLQKEIEQFKAKAAGDVKGDLINKIEKNGDVNVLIEEVDLDAASVKNIAFQLKAEVENLFLVLASKAGGKPTVSVLISDNLVKEKGWNAGQIVRDLAKHIQGGGGGQPFFATAGGKNPEGIKEVLKAARGIVD
ncbi:MAG: alanine--tRNA ligase [Flavobacteriales bacterium]|nr:alanine--tRNA ligase [Flavobacteriales bacterium]|tara:strand:+ start:740 stop:3346 length:2607 start_codon:yes stop_codon:yes gene_type:complete